MKEFWDMVGEILSTALYYGGIPALALVIMFLLFRNYGFKFAQVGPKMTAVIVLVLVIGVLIVTTIAVVFFRDVKPPVAYNNDNLGGMAAQARKDPGAKIAIVLAGSVAEQQALSRLQFGEMSAPTTIALMEKFCAANIACVLCAYGDQKPTLVTISKTGEITDDCVDETLPVCCS